MPSDRVIGAVERSLRAKDTTVQLEEYHEEFSKYGTVKVLGEDWANQYWKTEAKARVKDPSKLHFQISHLKKLVLTKKPKSITVSGKQKYSFEINQSLPVLKSGKKLIYIIPNKRKVGIKVNHLKIKDVQELL